MNTEDDVDILKGKDIEENEPIVKYTKRYSEFRDSSTLDEVVESFQNEESMAIKAIER